MSARWIGGGVVVAALVWIGTQAAATEEAAVAPGEEAPVLLALGTPVHPATLDPARPAVKATPQGATTGVVGSPHDLSLRTSATDQVCVFCHTPHGAGAAGTAPLWNRATSASAFVMYRSETLDMAQEAAPGAESLACLSCHDGTLAFDQLVNAPGAGGTDPAAPSRGWTFLGGAVTTSTRVGPDLRGDHPISIHYDPVRDPDLHPVSAVLAGGLRLFGPEGDQVECASCHDPHGAGAPSFLRRANTGSALCLTCHRK